MSSRMPSTGNSDHTAAEHVRHHRRCDGDPERKLEVDKCMREYKDYLHKLWDKFPNSYHKLKEFVQRGNCQCGPSEREIRELPCRCAAKGRVCACSNQQLCSSCLVRCDTLPVADMVRVYDIDGSAQNPEDFLATSLFRSSDHDDMEALKVKLASDLKANREAANNPDHDAKSNDSHREPPEP